MKAQRDDMRAFMDGVLDVLKNMTVTREIIREKVQYTPPKEDDEKADVVPLEALSTGVKSDFTPTLQVSQKKNLSPKLVLAIEWLLANPDDMQESTRKVAAKLDISHTWVAQAKKMIESGDYREALDR